MGYADALKADAANHTGETLLLNTATGWVLSMKQAECWLETFAGLTMLGSHLVIWYYAPERKTDLVDQLDDIQDPSYYELQSDLQSELRSERFQVDVSLQPDVGRMNDSPIC